MSALGVGALAAAGLTAQGLTAQGAPAPYTAGKHAAKGCSATKAAHTATCGAEKLVDDKNVSPASTTPPSTGLTPAGLRDAYKLNGLSAGGRTVAIVDAYPNLERDLGVYRSQFGLSSCTTANGCLRSINQTGGTSLPRFNAGWAGEQALDVDAVSAAAPDAKIVVVQANSASFADLGTAVVTASKQPGVVAISNSYGGGDASDATYGSYYNHPGIAVTASTGDDGYQGGSYPASSYTTAVGGPSLVAASNSRGWSETAWDGAGSGCSTYNTALSAAASFTTGCSKRAMADVSAAADPANPQEREAAEAGKQLHFGSHSVGVDDGSAGLPITGWSTGRRPEDRSLPRRPRPAGDPIACRGPRSARPAVPGTASRGCPDRTGRRRCGVVRGADLAGHLAGAAG